MTTVTLFHPDIQSGHSFTNVLLIDNQVTNYQVFVDSVNSSTFPIVYSSTTTKIELTSLLETHFNNIDRIALCFLGNAIEQDTSLFLDSEPFFTHSNSEGVEPSGENMEWIISTINTFHVKNIDYLACETLQYSSWSAYYTTLTHATGVIVGASDDKTGNIKYGGDWVMESTMEDIQNVYFGENIEYYQYLLDGVYDAPGNLTYTYVTSTLTTSVKATTAVSVPAALEIPSVISLTGNIYSVTSIDSNGFSGATSLTSITIPAGVTSIGANAFFGATSLTSVKLYSSTITALNNNGASPPIPTEGGSISSFYGSGTVAITNLGNNVNVLGISSYSQLPERFPSSNACFPCGTLVRTDQGEVAIEKLCKSVHTVRGRNVLGVTAITNVDDKVVLFKAHSLFPNVPCRDTYVSLNHKVFYDGNMHCARVFAAHIDFPNVIFVPDSHSVLYNVLLSEHVHMLVSNLLVETLDPSHALSALLLCEDRVRYERMLQEYNACAARVWPQGALPPAPPVLG